MSKAEWQAHWKEAGQHETKSCPECAKRRTTKRQNRNRRERDQAMRDLGLVKTPYGWE